MVPSLLTPAAAQQQGQQGALASLTQALNANQQAYGGLQNQAQQQYLQNAGQVNANLTNAGLGNTTVAQTMQQAPLETLNNAMLNIQGQQQGQAANIYGQQAQTQLQGGDLLAQILQQQQQFNQRPGLPPIRQGLYPS